MSFLFKLTIAILIVFAILFPILISSDNKLSALFWKIPKDFWVFLIIMYWAIITVVFIESSEQARIRRQYSDKELLFLASINGHPAVMADLSGNDADVAQKVSLFLAMNEEPPEKWQVVSSLEHPDNWEPTAVGS